MLANFLEASGCRRDWNATSFIDDSVRRIRETVGDGRVLCALSGGVDSAVAALLVHRAIGDRLVCVFVDNGLLRKDEATQVRKRFADKLKLKVVFVDATRRFLSAPARRDRPRAEAEDHRPRVHHRVPAGGEEDEGLRLPRPGHAVSRRHRVHVGARALRGDQEPPQRGRAAEEARLQAGRAAARAVQGRGARGGAAAGARRGVRPPPAVPRPRAGGALPGPDHARASWTSCARRTTSSRGRSRPRASTARSGSRSRCCSRCDRWA